MDESTHSIAPLHFVKQFRNVSTFQLQSQPQNRSKMSKSSPPREKEIDRGIDRPPERPPDRPIERYFDRGIDRSPDKPPERPPERFDLKVDRMGPFAALGAFGGSLPVGSDLWGGVGSSTSSWLAENEIRDYAGEWLSRQKQKEFKAGGYTLPKSYVSPQTRPRTAMGGGTVGQQALRPISPVGGRTVLRAK